MLVYHFAAVMHTCESCSSFGCKYLLLNHLCPHQHSSQHLEKCDSLNCELKAKPTIEAKYKTANTG